MIYVIKNDADGLCKIGYSKNPKKRLAELSTGSSSGLTLLFAIPGDKKHEAHIHKMFSRHHVRLEWFRLDAAALSFLEGLTPPVVPGIGGPFRDIKAWQRPILSLNEFRRVVVAEEAERVAKMAFAGTSAIDARQFLFDVAAKNFLCNVDEYMRDIHRGYHEYLCDIYAEMERFREELGAWAMRVAQFNNDVLVFDVAEPVAGCKR